MGKTTGIRISDFKNFEQFKLYIKDNGEEMAQWSPEQMKEYTDKVMALCESDSEFREQYAEWARNLANKQKTRVTIGESEKDVTRSQALFLSYSRQYVEERRYWTPEYLKKYTDEVMALCESDSEFRELYTKWARNLANKQKNRITIGGTEKDDIRSRALHKLKKIQQQGKNDKERETPKESTSNPDIVILAKRKKIYSI